MKLKLLFFLLILISIRELSNAQTTGGPDAFGYHWANNFDTLAAAPDYNWIDIKDTVNLVKGLSDDNASGPLNIGFYFGYYGKWYDSLWVGSNGWVAFQQIGNITAPFPVIPSPATPGNFIAGMLSDLTLKDSKNLSVPGAAVYFRTNHKDTAIIQYDSIPFWDKGTTGYSGRNTFQIILVGSESSITFQYKQLINSTPPYDLHITGLKTGIEDSTGKSGLQVLSDTFPSDSSAVKFFFPGLFPVNDLDNTYLSLNQNFPNPCNASTVISYALTKNENVNLTVQNLIGEQVASLPIGNKPAGLHSFHLNTSDLSPGIYFYTLTIKEKSATRKMIIVQ